MYSQDNSNKASRALANEALIRLDDFTAWIEECPKQRAHARLKGNILKVENGVHVMWWSSGWMKLITFNSWSSMLPLNRRMESLISLSSFVNNSAQVRVSISWNLKLNGIQNHIL